MAVKRIVWIACLALACSAGGGGSAENETTQFAAQPSFDVRGRWEGTASDDDTVVNVELLLTNNGGTFGMELAGQLELGGLGTFPFANSYIAPLPGATRPAVITAADSNGFSYEIRGEFTNLRLSGGQFASSNPAADIDVVFLDVELLKVD